MNNLFLIICYILYIRCLIVLGIHMDVFVNIKILNLLGEAIINLIRSMLIVKHEQLAFILYATLFIYCNKQFFLIFYFRI